ncbi:hypothetical protein KC327_g80 [Hortaea werneckii]|nr:hypothetical protein KC327_g80 [Hortaea werneckii]
MIPAHVVPVRYLSCLRSWILSHLGYAVGREFQRGDLIVFIVGRILCFKLIAHDGVDGLRKRRAIVGWFGGMRRRLCRIHVSTMGILIGSNLHFYAPRQRAIIPTG